MRILKRHDEYNDCLDDRTHFPKFDTTDKALEWIKPEFSIVAEIYQSNSESSYRSVKTDDVLIVGDTYEKCLEAFFVQQRQWTYCNDINIKFADNKDKDNFSDFFYGNGIGAYAKCGGNMD